MSNKELEVWAHHIGTEVAYHDNRQIVTEAVIQIARKTRKSFTDKDERYFKDRCIYWETNQ